MNSLFEKIQQIYRQDGFPGLIEALSRAALKVLSTCWYRLAFASFGDGSVVTGRITFVGHSGFMWEKNCVIQAGELKLQPKTTAASS